MIYCIVEGLLNMFQGIALHFDTNGGAICLRLNDILKKSSIGGKRINHIMLYADDLCIVSLSSAGLQQLLSICDQYCAMHSITFNVKQSVCMFLDVV